MSVAISLLVLALASVSYLAVRFWREKEQARLSARALGDAALEFQKERDELLADLKAIHIKERQNDAQTVLDKPSAADAAERLRSLADNLRPGLLGTLRAASTGGTTQD